MIRFCVDRHYIRSLYAAPYLSTECILAFAKEHNCTIVDSGFQFETTEEDYIILKLKHPRVIVARFR